MEKLTHYLIGLLCLSMFFACQSDWPPTIEEEMATLPDQIDYNFHVKPILSDRCFACHGPDAQKREANLRLDIAEAAFAKLDGGEGHAIVPGNASRSAMVSRILHHDAEVVMPPPESNLTLEPYEQAMLIKWIEQGATYKSHWAFTAPELPEVPTVKSDEVINEIDQFVFHQLEQKDIQPAPPAQREQLIRRLYFDVTGLPPNLKELDYWLAQPEDKYYEQLIDQLLASPAYGERMAAHWLDVARFADSEGYLDDFHHTFWPYRDWVIRAFNDNLSYDQFVLWQVGGDQIPNATEDQILATAFNRNHKQNSEGGIISEEFRVEYVADRTNTVGAAFMGLTMGCARCHDHKYDPISQENYFELFSFFNSTVERGDGIFSNNAIENGQMVANKFSMNSGPVMPLPNEEVKKIRDYLLGQIDEKQQHIKALAAKNESSFDKWRNAQQGASVLEAAVRSATVSQLSFDDMQNGKAGDRSKTASFQPYYYGRIESAPGRVNQAIRSNADGQFIADGSASSFERNEPFTISFWINTPRAYNEAHVLYNGNNRIQGFRGWDVMQRQTIEHY
ncbi:MAG: DUF1549 domain-containing protein, partial [Bacteroidota bacterium]